MTDLMKTKRYALALAVSVALTGCGPDSGGGSSDGDSGDNNNDEPAYDPGGTKAESFVEGVSNDRIQFIFAQTEAFLPNTTLVSYFDSSGALVSGETTTLDDKGSVSLDALPTDGSMVVEIDQGTMEGGGRQFTYIMYDEGMIDGGETVAIADPTNVSQAAHTYDIEVTNSDEFNDFELMAPSGVGGDEPLKDIPANPLAGTNDRKIMVKGLREDGEVRYGIHTIEEVRDGATYRMSVDQRFENFQWGTNETDIGMASVYGDLGGNNPVSFDIKQSDNATDPETASDVGLGTEGVLNIAPEADTVRFSAMHGRTKEDNGTLRTTATKNRVVNADDRAISIADVPDKATLDYLDTTEALFKGTPEQKDAVTQTTLLESIMFDNGDFVSIYSGNLGAVTNTSQMVPDYSDVSESYISELNNEGAKPNSINRSLTMTQSPLREQHIVNGPSVEVMIEGQRETGMSEGESYSTFTTMESETIR